MNFDRRTKVSGGWEKHLTTALAGLLTAGVGYMVAELVTLTRANALSAQQNSYIITQITELRADLKSIQGQFVRIDQFVDHETRLRTLESKSK